MKSLCQNREEGWGPSSHLSSPIPTTCFNDTIIIPLPVWLYLPLLPLLFFLTLKVRKSAKFNPSTAHLRLPRTRSCLRTTLSVLYYLLIVANILMVTLEIVRMALIHRSITLLPFQYVGLLLGGAVHAANGVWGRIKGLYWRSLNAMLWVGLTIVTAVKVGGLVVMWGKQNGKFDRKGTKYPLSDQVIDVSVMAGVYLVIAVLEVALGAWRGKKEKGLGPRVESQGEEVGIVQEHQMQQMDVIGWAK